MRGILLQATDIFMVKASGSTLRIEGAQTASGSGGALFRPDFNFEDMGIGGLDEVVFPSSKY